MLNNMNYNEILKTSLSYTNYRTHVNELIDLGKTTGDNQTEQLLEFTKLNVQRMNRLDKTIIIPEEKLIEIKTNTLQFIWLLIGDAWCGDCAQILPVINKIAETSENTIDLKIISRDAFPELIEQHLTNGGKAVPKLLVIEKDTSNVVITWGPRPKTAQSIMLNWKANQNTITWEDYEKELHLWYTKNKGLEIIDELTQLITQCKKQII